MNLFDSIVDNLVAQAEKIATELESLPDEQRIEALNRIRLALHRVSPFRDEPVDCVLWVPADSVNGNDYNPNAVAPPEMRLLLRSIMADGYTQPIVGVQEGEQVTVVDGFHRSRVGRESKHLRRRLHDRLPVALIKPGRGERKDRMAATIRHNRARGVHGVLPMTDIVAELIRRGWSDDEVAAELGMDADEVLRFKHNSGLPELFRGHDYSQAWE